MFNRQKDNPTATRNGGVMGRDYGRIAKVATGLILTATVIAALPAAGQASDDISKESFSFVNAVDSTQGFSQFAAVPAINNGGAVAFVSGTGISRWQNGRVTKIASSGDKVLSGFGENVIINSSGRVGFAAKVTTTNDAIIASGDGGTVTTIASAAAQGLLGGPFLTISGMNESGTAVFLALRKGLASQAIFSGRGGALTAVVDTARDTNFIQLGAPDIDDAGQVVFHGFPVDGSEGIFSTGGGFKVIASTNNSGFTGFLDPVMNNAGTAATAAFLATGGFEVFTGTPGHVTPHPSSFLTSVDNVSINNSGDLAFIGTTTAGVGSIFFETSRGGNAVTVIEPGDHLFGSTVAGVSVGRFSLNDRGDIVFRYQLADGRSGIAVATRRNY